MVRAYDMADGCRSGQASRGGVKGTLDRLCQCPSGLGGQLDGDPRRRTLCGVDEVDVERVIGERVRRVVEINADLAQPEPAGRALAAACRGYVLGGVRAHGYSPARCRPKKAQTLSQPSTAASTR